MNWIDIGWDIVYGLAAAALGVSCAWALALWKENRARQIRERLEWRQHVNHVSADRLHAYAADAGVECTSHVQFDPKG